MHISKIDQGMLKLQQKCSLFWIFPRNTPPRKLCTPVEIKFLILFLEALSRGGQVRDPHWFVYNQQMTNNTSNHNLVAVPNEVRIMRLE